jgi:hypothetical protein
MNNKTDIYYEPFEKFDKITIFEIGNGIRAYVVCQIKEKVILQEGSEI